MPVNVTYPLSPPQPYPMALPWVAGRYYQFAFGTSADAPTNTMTIGHTLYAIPFLIPNSVKITSMGIEVTTAATSATVARLGLYSSDAYGFPADLLFDGGTFLVDTTGFKSVSPNYRVNAGLYWTLLGSQIISAQANYRCKFGGNSRELYAFSNETEKILFETNPQQPANAITFSDTYDHYTLHGYSKAFPRMSINPFTMLLGSNNIPRVMLGV